MVGIISNIAALAAQSNLNTAATQSQSSIYRLSSGNAIAQASDNVAGLAIGTILKTNVSTLKTALTNTTQANSLLGVADGALANIGDILQRQKALATQAISGSLTNQARSFLNQEFQSLKAEVDRIATTTNFNGINLIDGSLYGPNTMETYTRNNATYATGQILQYLAGVAGCNLALTDADGNSVTFTYAAAATIAGDITYSDDALLYIDTTNNTTIAEQVKALYQQIQDILNYSGTDTTIIDAKATLSKMSFSSDSATYIDVTSLAAGSIGNSIQVTTNTASTYKINGTALPSATATAITANGTAAINGDLNAGTFGGATAFAGSATTIATGSIGDSILAAINTTTQASTGVDVSLIANNPAFVGTLQGFTATYEGINQVSAQITVGGIQYVAQSINTDGSSGHKVTFGSISGDGGSFTVKMAANLTVNNQNDANTFATRLNQAFSTVIFEQNRIMSNFTAAGAVYGTPGGNATGDLAGSQFNFINSDFEDIAVQSVTVTAPVLGGTISKISIEINGETYVSGYTSTGAVASAGLDGATSGTVITAGDTIGLVSTVNPNHMIQFKYGGGNGASTNLDISNAANAQAFQVALSDALGINSGATNISFQVGTTASDAIAVQIQAASSTFIYLDDAGTSRGSSIAVDNLNDAISASGILDNAINTVTAIRAGVGALESRFNYAASNVNTSIQNLDAARSTFLDTDIAAESTNFAQEQVRLQASISVLAQANQLPQNLLKLID